MTYRLYVHANGEEHKQAETFESHAKGAKYVNRLNRKCLRDGKNRTYFVKEE